MSRLSTRNTVRFAVHAYLLVETLPTKGGEGSGPVYSIRVKSGFGRCRRNLDLPDPVLGHQPITRS